MTASEQPAEGAQVAPRPFKFEVWDTVIWEVEIDLNDPSWAYIAEGSENPDEWIAALDDEANQPDSEIAAIVKRLTPADASREVNHHG